MQFPRVDEPSGALDSHSTEDVLRLFDDLNAEGRTIVVITHAEEVASRTHRVLRMRDGKVLSDLRPGCGRYHRAAHPTAARPTAERVGVPGRPDPTAVGR